MAKILMKANEAFGRAAIQAGCHYFFGYPITPQSELPENLKIVANIRLEHPDASLTDLVNLLGNTISKSGMSHRLTALSKIADELRDK